MHVHPYLTVKANCASIVSTAWLIKDLIGSNIQDSPNDRQDCAQVFLAWDFSAGCRCFAKDKKLCITSWAVWKSLSFSKPILLLLCMLHSIEGAWERLHGCSDSEIERNCLQVLLWPWTILPRCMWIPTQNTAMCWGFLQMSLNRMKQPSNSVYAPSILARLIMRSHGISPGFQSCLVQPQGNSCCPTSLPPCNICMIWSIGAIFRYSQPSPACLSRHARCNTVLLWLSCTILKALSLLGQLKEFVCRKLCLSAQGRYVSKVVHLKTVMRLCTSEFQIGEWCELKICGILVYLIVFELKISDILVYLLAL